MGKVRKPKDCSECKFRPMHFPGRCKKNEPVTVNDYCAMFKRKK